MTETNIAVIDNIFIIRDLALALRRKLGDWSRVAELQKSNTETDSENQSTYDQMGNYYCDRHQYSEACHYYKLARNNAKLAECSYNMEDYELLEQLAESLDQAEPLVPKIAAMFASVGLCQQAVQCYLKVGFYSYLLSYLRVNCVEFLVQSNQSCHRNLHYVTPVEHGARFGEASSHSRDNDAPDIARRSPVGMRQTIRRNIIY